MAARILTLLLFSLTAFGQNTVTWLESVDSLPALPPVNTRTYALTGTEATGWKLWKWNSASAASTNSAVVKYTGSVTGRWLASDYTGGTTNLTTKGTTTVPAGSHITLVAGSGIKGELYARNNDLTDLASVDPAAAGTSHSQHVLYDGAAGYPFNRIYQWDATSTDSADSDAEHPQGVSIVIPDMEPWTSSPSTAGRWIMLQ